MGTPDDFWQFLNSTAQLMGGCNSCNSSTREEPAPAGSPPEIDTVVRCDGCDKIVDAL